MKILFLAPAGYPFIRSVESGIRQEGIECRLVDFGDFIPPVSRRWVGKLDALPGRLREAWRRSYEGFINKRYREVFADYRPDLVLIYNHQFVAPDTLEHFRKQAKIAFMLGDHPLFSLINRNNVHLLFQSDYSICPDTWWIDQLSRMGIKNLHFDCFSFDESVFFPQEVSSEERSQYGSEFIYIGMNHRHNWGYKRFLFLNLFRDYDLKAYISGKGIDQWLAFFPALRNKVIPYQGYNPSFNNLVYNCSKIAPVEKVPSLFNGIHVRVFDALGAGILPLCENSGDLQRVFPDIELPIIEHYSEGPALAAYWLREDARRTATVAAMRQQAMENYAPRLVVRRMVESVFKG